MSHSESTQRKVGRSGAGALIVGAFVYVVFDNLALAIIAGLFAAGGIATRPRDGAGSGQQSPDVDGAA